MIKEMRLYSQRIEYKIEELGNYSQCEEDDLCEEDFNEIEPIDVDRKSKEVIGYKELVKVWGKVKDPLGNPIINACVRLSKMTSEGLIGVADTVSDSKGYYQFDVCPWEDGLDFKIIVLKDEKEEHKDFSNKEKKKFSFISEVDD